MIFNAEWRRQFQSDVLIRLGVAHPDLTRIAGLLRNTAQVDVWTESPSDQTKLTAGKQSYSLEGWRAFYGSEYQRFNTWNTAHGAKLQAYDSQAKAALDGYLASMPIIGTAFANVMANYKDGSNRVIQTLIGDADRATLATAIEAQLQ